MAQLVVAGGGPAGLAAAVAAARRGVATILVERYGFLGGMATAALVNPFMMWEPGQQPLVRGIFQEVLERLSAKGGFSSPRQPSAFDPEALKIAADEICAEAGVEVKLHTFLTAAATKGGRITSIATESKSGRRSLRARLFIDCTGDADLAHRAGVACEIGRAEDGLTQPMTLNFRMAGVEIERMPPGAEINRRYDAAKAEGRVRCPRENVLFFYAIQPDVVHFNTTRVVGKSGVEAGDLTSAEIEARRQTQDLVRFLVSDIPGFEHAYLQRMATQIGVRETRRIRGEYTLTADDVLAGRKFPDGIARSAYPIDIHSPTGAGTVIRGVPAGDYYEIPYRCLVPVGVDNLLVAGRSVSATHEAQASLRVMPQCFAMGEAAGVAASLAIERSISPREVDGAELRAIIERQAWR
ncbi:MAG: FAD-dependent oxidoreductase [Armatimonadota bacterium]